MHNKYSIFSVLSVAGIGFVLTITMFLVNQRQDLRQQASSALKEPAPTVEVSGCPAQSPDGRANVCRAEANCPLGEVEKENGSDECTKKLGKLAICCIVVSPRK